MVGKNLNPESISTTEEKEILVLPKNISSVLDKTHEKIGDVIDINYQELNPFGFFKNYIELLLSPVNPEKWATILDILKEKRFASMNVLDKNKKGGDQFKYNKVA